jgi:hypothetical protein
VNTSSVKKFGQRYTRITRPALASWLMQDLVLYTRHGRSWFGHHGPSWFGQRGFYELLAKHKMQMVCNLTKIQSVPCSPVAEPLWNELLGNMRMEVKNTFLHFCLDQPYRPRSRSAPAIMTKTIPRQRDVSSHAKFISPEHALPCKAQAEDTSKVPLACEVIGR